MLKVRVHNLINGAVYEQFNVHNRNNRIQVPHLLKNSHMGGESATTDVASPLFYKFYTDNTGNNHPVVRQILKRRCWYQRVDNLKGPNVFDQTSFFWTQWKRSKIVEKLTQNQIYGKIEGNGLIANKSHLLTTMQSYFKEMHARQEVVNSPHSNVSSKILKSNKGNARR